MHKTCIEKNHDRAAKGFKLTKMTVGGGVVRVRGTILPPISGVRRLINHDPKALGKAGVLGLEYRSNALNVDSESIDLCVPY
jgi:hypothetical protein